MPAMTGNSFHEGGKGSQPGNSLRLALHVLKAADREERLWLLGNPASLSRSIIGRFPPRPLLFKPTSFMLRSISAPTRRNVFRFLAGALVAASLSKPDQACAQAPTFPTTVPVGFVALVVNGQSTGGTTSFSFRSLGLARAVEFEGVATTVTENTIAITPVEGAEWTDGKFNGAAGSHYVEITGPAAAAGIGTMYDIVNTSLIEQNVTLAQNLATGIQAGATFRIRKHWTIGTVFGPNNEGGLTGGVEGQADTVLIYNGGAYTSFYYSTGGSAGTGWRKAGDTVTDQSDQVLYPDDGMIITRQQAGPVKLLLMGTVRTGQTSFPIVPGMNLVGNPYSAPMTLSSSQLYTGSASTGVKPGSASTGDQVLIFNGSAYDAYYYSTGGLSGTGWRKVGGKTDASSTPLPVAGSFVVQRKDGAGFNWVIPQHPSSL
jgi:uncharacterized protein (TIGR02597 family)